MELPQRMAMVKQNSIDSDIHNPDEPYQIPWFTIFSIFLDCFVLVTSSADIILDVLVTIEFYELEHYECFWVSLSIFILAQFSYAFLFACTWARNHGAWGQIGVFFAILPFGQFVPFFTFAESFHFESMDKFIQSWGLTPTEKLILEDGQDSLWLYLQNKYQAWSGFLIEAFVEAIPQCLLQTIAVIIYGKATTLNLLSIIVSVVVIASKGYLISYSLDRKTFAFNICCVACDVFNLFAIICWLFHDDAHLLKTGLWKWFAGIGMALSALAGFSLLMFSIFDDHLKKLHGLIQCKNVFYSFYVVRIIGWFLAIECVSVLYHVTKLTLIPIFVLRSLDPEQSLHFDFYTSLFEFLDAPDRATRLRVVNTYFAQAKSCIPDLQRRLDRMTVRRDSKLKLEEIEKWAKTVGQKDLEDEYAQKLVAAAMAATSDEAALKEIQRLNMQNNIDATANSHLDTVENKSILIGKGVKPRGCKQILLKRLAQFTFGCLVFFGFFWVLVTICHVVYGVFFPFFQLGHCFNSDFNDVKIQCTLTFGNLFFFVILLILCPFVYKFQILQYADLMNIRGFPSVFYSTSILEEIKSRYEIIDLLIEHFGDVAQDIMSFL